MRTFRHPLGILPDELPEGTVCEVCSCQLGQHRAYDLACPFKWVIEVIVSEHAVADGLDFVRVTPDDMVRRSFPFCGGNDIEARAISCPDKSSIREAQGFTEDDRETDPNLCDRWEQP